MKRIWEHVERAHPVGPQAEARELGQISTESRRVAGDVHDHVGATGGHGFDDRAPGSGPGRIENDMLRAFAGRVHPSEARVREWMTAEPVAVSAATPIEAAVTMMTEYGVHHLPVVEDERPTGMLGLRQAARRARLRGGIGLGF